MYMRWAPGHHLEGRHSSSSGARGWLYFHSLWFIWSTYGAKVGHIYIFRPQNDALTELRVVVCFYRTPILDEEPGEWQAKFFLSSHIHITERMTRRYFSRHFLIYYDIYMRQNSVLTTDPALLVHHMWKEMPPVEVRRLNRRYPITRDRTTALV